MKFTEYYGIPALAIMISLAVVLLPVKSFRPIVKVVSVWSCVEPE